MIRDRKRPCVLLSNCPARFHFLPNTIASLGCAETSATGTRLASCGVSIFQPPKMSLDVAESRVTRGSGGPKRGNSIPSDLWGAGFDPAKYPDCPEAAGVLLQSNRSTFKL